MFAKMKLVAAALALAAPLAVAGPAHAQARGVGVVSLDAAIQGTNAYRTAAQQIQTTYATQMQQAQARTETLQAELRPLQQAYQQAVQAPGATAESVRPAAEALERRRVSAQQEINQLQAPYLRAIAYVREQIMAQIEAPMQAAMAAANVDLVVQPEAVLSMTPNSPANLTTALTAQLNSRVPSVQAIPPEGWQQGDTLQAAQQQQQSQQPAQQPQGR